MMELFTDIAGLIKHIVLIEKDKVHNLHIAGIYLFERTTNDKGPKYYVGQAKDIAIRYGEHHSSNPKDPDCSNIDLAINNYGEEKFKFYLLEVVDKTKKELNDELDNREKCWIKIFNPKVLYNKNEKHNANNIPEKYIKLKDPYLYEIISRCHNTIGFKKSQKEDYDNLQTTASNNETDKTIEKINHLINFKYEDNA